MVVQDTENAAMLGPLGSHREWLERNVVRWEKDLERFGIYSSRTVKDQSKEIRDFLEFADDIHQVRPGADGRGTAENLLLTVFMHRAQHNPDEISELKKFFRPDEFFDLFG